MVEGGEGRKEAEEGEVFKSRHLCSTRQRQVPRDATFRNEETCGLSPIPISLFYLDSGMKGCE